MGAGPGARGAIDNDDAADIARRAVDHEVGAALVDTTQTLVCILDRDGRIVRFNPACERVTGWTSEEVVGRDARETVIPPEDHAAFVAMIRGMVATGAPNPQQGQWVTRDGYRRVIAWANRPLRDEQGAVRYVVTSGLDITERESAASELWALQAELRDRLEDLSRLAAEQAALRRVATLVAREPPAEGRLPARDRGGQPPPRRRVRPPAELRREPRVGDRRRPLHRARDARVRPRDGRCRSRATRSRAPCRAAARPGALDSYAGLTGEIARRAREGQYRSVVAAPVVVAGRVWGLLVAATQRDEPLASNAEQRLESFAELVALALAGADARRELAASRTRIVEAGDAARRRLERDLHDGAQQRLVAVSLQMRLARARVDKRPDGRGRDPRRGGRAARPGPRAAARARARDPPGAAHRPRPEGGARGAASRAPFPVGLDVVDERFAQPVEVAVYYLVSEALTNAAKYAEPTGVSVTVQRTDDGLAAEIADDGGGGADPAGGTGLRGLGDRVEALGGRLRIDSPPGAGTRIRAELPLR